MPLSFKKPLDNQIEKITPFTPINFKDVDRQANAFADVIEERREELTDILLEYESYEVANDEIERSLDLLRNLKENKKYFVLRIGAVTTFLPRNQPLYALTCFVIVPSLMAGEVHFRIPHSMKGFLEKVIGLLGVQHHFPNIYISQKQRLEFLRERSALYTDMKKKNTWPVTDVVIFNGTPVHADQLRLVFDSRTLFIANGAGHNPIIVSSDAHIKKAVEATLIVSLYNQGQDCTAPNAILVQQDILPQFLTYLRAEIEKIKVGKYTNRSKSIGPISDPDDIVRIQDFLIEHRNWIDISTPGIINTLQATLEPTIICKPLKEGGNYTEIFAPVIFLQEYKEDNDLSFYFENSRYLDNAMYITLYGSSKYVMSLTQKSNTLHQFHNKASILHNKHLHFPGIERGTQAFGGYGPHASSLSINGKIIAKPTLPQRDIYEWIVAPLSQRTFLAERINTITKEINIVEKDVQKLLRLKHFSLRPQESTQFSEYTYLDSDFIKDSTYRYFKINNEYLYQLLDYPNKKYIATMTPKDIELIRILKTSLTKQSVLPQEEFSKWLYELAKEPDATEKENRLNQSKFFTNIYELLLGKTSGPRLVPFLLEIDRQKVHELLDL